MTHALLIYMGLQVPQKFHKKLSPARHLLHLLLPMMLLSLPGASNLLAHSAVTGSMKTKPQTCSSPSSSQNTCHCCGYVGFHSPIGTWFIWSNIYLLFIYAGYTLSVKPIMSFFVHHLGIWYNFHLSIAVCGCGFFSPRFFESAAAQQTLYTPKLCTIGTKTD